MNSARRPGLFWPLLLVGLGGLLLLQTIGLLPAGMWGALALLWPVLLILLGLDMLAGRRSAGGALLVLALGALVVIASLAWAALRANSLPAGGTQPVYQFRGTAQAAAVKLDYHLGELNVSAMDDAARLMAGETRRGPGESVQQAYYLTEGAGQLTLSQQQAVLFAPFLASRGASSRWDLKFTSSLPLALEISTGVGTANLDLSGLYLTRLDLKTGVGQTQVSFPASGPLSATVKSGMGDVTLTIPPDVPTRITVESGLAGVNIPARFGREGNVYTTFGFSAAGHYLDLKLQAGVGTVTVK